YFSDASLTCLNIFRLPRLRRLHFHTDSSAPAAATRTTTPWYDNCLGSGEWNVVQNFVLVQLKLHKIQQAVDNPRLREGV
ncbi:Serine/threonine-protein kinase ssn3, partial [Frankliniella fusca]